MPHIHKLQFKSWSKIWGLAYLALSLGACDTPQDSFSSANLKLRAALMAANDHAVSGPIDLSRPAIIETNYLTPKSPSCSGYCLRLLYSGKAKSVISGFAVSTQARHSPDYHEFYRNGADTPATLQNLQIAEYSLEQRPSCPQTPHHESWDFYPKGSDDAHKQKTAAQLADLKIGQGFCLIENKASLANATSILIFSDEYWTNSKDSSFINAKHLTVYGKNKAGLARLYRHTRAYMAYYPQLLPKQFDDASFERGHELEPRLWPDIMRTDLGLKLENLRPADQDAVRNTIKRLLADKTLERGSLQWAVVGDYLEGLEEAKSAKPEDIALFGELALDPRLGHPLSRLSWIMVRNHEQNRSLAKPLLTALLATPAPSKASSKSEAKFYATRLEALSNALGHVPHDSVKQNEALLFQLVSDPEKRVHAKAIFWHLGYMSPSIALPLAVRFSHDSDRVLQDGGLQALCTMGEDARPALSDILQYIRENPDDDDKPAYGYAWTSLVMLDLADKYMQEFKLKPEFRRQLASYQNMKRHGRMPC